MVKLCKNNDNEDGQEEEEGIAAAEHEDMVVLDTMGEKQMDLRVVGPLRVWMMILVDLVKVENQIPFTIIQTLFSMLQTPGDEDIDLFDIACDLLKTLDPSRLSKSLTDDLPLPDRNEVQHLLHLFHSTMVPSHECLKINSTKQSEMDIQWIPSATELQLAGVEFMRKKERVSSFLDISFINGTIEVPQISLDDRTNALFRNLLAYEQCCYPKTEAYVTAYACFMDYMINSPKDVELFELKGIFVNLLGTPDQAATLINHLGDQTLDSTNSYLQGSIQRVKKYYKSKCRRWRAKCMRDYFGNPWSILSLVAALILLLLTVEQSFFSAYSYFRPPKN